MRTYLAVALLTLTSCGTKNVAKTEELKSEVEAIDPSATEIALAKKLLLERLKDPESARFREVVRSETPESALTGGSDSSRLRVVFCGEFNSKNALGGYSGYSPFAVILPSSSSANDAEVRIVETFDQDFEGQAAAQGALAKMQCDLGERKRTAAF